MKYHCIKQHDITDCGAACLATICKQNGYKIGITQIREVAGTDKQGTNAYGVIKAAEQLGFSAKGVKGTKEAFFSEFPLPCIAHVIVDGQLLHYVVIHKITKKQVIIADPGVGIVKLKPEEFFGEVHEEGKVPKYQWSGVLILLVKNETFKKGDETKGLFSRFFHLLLPQKKLVLHIFVVASTENTTANIEELKKQRDALITAQDSAKKEKTRALRNLELQQITTIEQQIAGYNDTILSLETNLASAKLQLEAINSADNETKESVAILTEKGKVAAEILNYEDKVKECETYLKSYDIQNDNCVIKANVSGYFYIAQDLKTGSFVQEGTTIGTIYPETESKYYAEIYVENTDIAQIREGQDVKFEIAAYPFSEYGYFKGTVENIAKNISVDQSTGYSYYLVRVKCDNMTLKGKNGEEATLMNGMACQAKIVIDEKNVLTYFGEKIDLLD
jgi:hypothetical protein